MMLTGPAVFARYLGGMGRTLRSTLQQMGYQVSEVKGRAWTGEPSRPPLSSQITLEVELASDKKSSRNSELSEVIVRLDDGDRPIQVTLDCLTLSCDPSALVSWVRRSAAMLLDLAQRANGSATMFSSQVQSGECDLNPPCSVPVPTHPPAVAPAGTVPRVPTPPPTAATFSCRQNSRPKKIAGGLLVAVGLSAVIGSGIVYGLLQGQTERLPPDAQSFFRRDVVNARPALAGIAAGGAATLSGSILIGFASKPQNSEAGGQLCGR